MIGKAVILFSDYLSKSYWLNVLFTHRTFETIFSVLGKVWFVVTILSFFIPATKLYISNHAYITIGIVSLILVWTLRPRLSVESNVESCDFHIEIKVGNIFDFRGAYVISTNTTFDTDTDIVNGYISINSLQGQATNKFYKNQISDLDSDLDRLLEREDFNILNDDRIGKRKRYPVGTVVQLKKLGKVLYWVAIADLNNQGSIEGVEFDDIKKSLSQLWKKIETSGNIDPVVIPLLGSSRCRINKSRIEFVKEIVNSFVLASKEKKLCERLIIVISPQDYKQYKIDLNHLGEYLNCRCSFTELLATNFERSK